MKYQSEVQFTDAISFIKGLVATEPSTLFILSPTSTRKLLNQSFSTNQELKAQFQQALGLSGINQVVFTDEMSYDDLDKMPDLKSYSAVVAIGGGSAIDYAKYIGYNYQCKVVAIPAMLSTNVFSTNKVACINKGKKHTVQGKLPDVTVVDVKYLEKSHEENLYGIVDILSIFTASMDWKLANANTGLEITPEYDRANALLNKTLELCENGVESMSTLEIFNIVCESGYITNDYGSGRPESGSEHIFASGLETKIKIPHALAVGIGIAVMSYMHKVPYAAVQRLFFLELGVFNGVDCLNVKYPTIYEVFSQLKPRPDKYTIVDTFSKNDKDLFYDIKDYLTQVGFSF